MNTRDTGKWLEISIEVDGEMAEAVAEVFARFIPDGIVIESLNIADDPDGEGYPIGNMRVCGYLPQDKQVDQNRQKLEEAVWHLGLIRELPPVKYTIIETQNWVESWKVHYHPFRVGKKLMIVPAWLDSNDSTRLAIHINPGMAFGTGTHPTTRLCLEILDELIPLGFDTLRKDETGISDNNQIVLDSMIDLGCGSGILSIAAHKLGVGQVIGVDKDQQAVENAKINALANNVGDGVEFHSGQLTDIQNGKFSIRRAPLIVANIMTHILIDLLDNGLVNLMERGGILILSGILCEQELRMTEAINRHSLAIVSRKQIDDWVALVLVQGFSG